MIDDEWKQHVSEALGRLEAKVDGLTDNVSGLQKLRDKVNTIYTTGSISIWLVGLLAAGYIGYLFIR